MRTKIWVSVAMLLALGVGLSGCMEKDNKKMMDNSMSAPMEDTMKSGSMMKEDTMMKNDSMDSGMNDTMK